jgi:hypothetical protein
MCPVRGQVGTNGPEALAAPGGFRFSRAAAKSTGDDWFFKMAEPFAPARFKITRVFGLVEVPRDAC